MKILPLIYRRQTSVVNKKAATFGVITLITYLIPENSEIELSVSARDFMIDWGDGVCDKNMIHTYTRKGEYVIRICGECINELRVPKCCLENGSNTLIVLLTGSRSWIYPDYLIWSLWIVLTMR